MTAPPPARSTGQEVWTAVRRSPDVAGAGVLAGGIALVALLAALVTGRWLLALLALVLLVLAGALIVVVARLLQPVRELTRDVRRVADAMTETAADVPGAVPEEGTGPRPPPVPARGTGDLAALATAVTSLQDAAFALAEAQHRSRLRTSELTVHLGRRNQGLLDRLVSRIGDLTIFEHDPYAHGELQRLHHVAGHARRHAESMLVLTDAQAERVGLRSAALADVLRAALAGVEDHARVDLTAVEPVAVAGSAAADLAHLVAELVENAAHFSPPEARIEVGGAVVAGSSYRIVVSDRGIGMTPAQLAEANDRVRASSTVATRLIGLDVVGRLAARHGIGVVLDRRDGGGIVATVTVPHTALVALSDLPAPRRPVSALVASAAFLPPRPSPRPVARLAPEVAPRPARPAVPTAFVRPGVPRRVPGAQLPDLGPERADDPRVTPDPGRIRGRLDALVAGLSAARTNNIPPLPRALPDAGDDDE